MSFIQATFNTLGMHVVFEDNFSRSTFTIIPSNGAVFSIYTAIDLTGELVLDELYKNCSNEVQDIVNLPGKFAIEILQVGENGVYLECKGYK